MLSVLLLVTAVFFSSIFFGLSWAAVVVPALVLLWVVLLVLELRDSRFAPAMRRVTAHGRERAARAAAEIRVRRHSSASA